MAQFGRPISDITNAWASGGFGEIDEASFDDGDLAYSNDNPGNALLEVALTASLTDPTSSTGHIVRWRHATVDGGVLDAGGTAVDLTVSLVQGTTVIASKVLTTINSATFVADSFTLSGAEADSITNYADLRIRFDPSGGGGNPANRRGAAVSWAELEIPNASGNVSVTLTHEVITLTDFAPTVTADISVTLTHEAVTITDFAPTISFPVSVVIPGLYDSVNSLDFDGIDDQIQRTAFSLASNTYTFLFWIEATTGWSGGECVLAGGSNTDSAIEFWNTGTQIQFLDGAGTSTIWDLPSSVLIGNGPHQLAFVRTGATTARVYLDGVESPDGELTIGSTAWSWTRIGKKGTLDWLHAKLDDILLWDGVAATAQNIIDLYNSGLGTDPTSVIANPRNWYKFNESGTDTTAVDSGSAAENGTLVGFPASGMWLDGFLDNVGTITTSDFAPTVTASISIVPTHEVVTLTDFIPTVSLGGTGVSVTLTHEAITATDFTPTVNAAASATLTHEAVTITDFAPTVTANISIVPTHEVVTTTDFVPTVNAAASATLAHEAITLTDFTPTVAANISIVPTHEVVTATDFAPTISIGGDISVTLAHEVTTVTDFTPTVTAQTLVNLPADVLTTTDFIPIITAIINISSLSLSRIKIKIPIKMPIKVFGIRGPVKII